MASLRAWLLCLLLLALVLPGASSRAHQHSMETRSKCLRWAASLARPSILSLDALSAQHLYRAWPSPKPTLPCLVFSLEDDLLVIRSC